MTIAIVDADPIVYKSACIGEERYIDVKHIPSGRVQEFKNKTEFYGRGKKKDGGWLGDLNTERESQGLSSFSIEDFEITEKQRIKEELANVLHTTKMLIAAPLEIIKADGMVCFLGGSAPLIRWEQST